MAKQQMLRTQNVCCCGYRCTIVVKGCLTIAPCGSRSACEMRSGLEIFQSPCALSRARPTPVMSRVAGTGSRDRLGPVIYGICPAALLSSASERDTSPFHQLFIYEICPWNLFHGPAPVAPFYLAVSRRSRVMLFA